MSRKPFAVLVAALALAIVFSIIVFSTSGCEPTRKEPTSDVLQARQTEAALSEAQRQIGLPNIANFQQRKLMKWIFELADKSDLVTYAYIKAEYTGKLIFVGKCFGYGIPFSAQFTNPEKVVHKNNYQGGSYGTLPQADPNGLFMPTSSSATWLIMVNPVTGEPKPIYFEPEIVVSPFPLSPHLGDMVIGDESKWGMKKGA